MTPTNPADWTIHSVARDILSEVRAQPITLILALAVVPMVWYVPASVLGDYLVPPSGSDGSARSVAAHIVVIVATTLWWGTVYAGQLQIAIDVARGGRVTWPRFLEGLRHIGRVSVTALPCTLPLGALIVLPDAPWLEHWVLVILPVAVGSAVLLTARCVLWAPLATDGGLALGTALSIAWSSSRGHVWRLVNLGVALALPLLPLFVLETIFLGESWFACGAVGALYTMATAHLYVSMRATVAHAATLSESSATRLDDMNQEGLNLPQAGSSWSKPFD
jgi:hypothetical protein